MPGKKWKPLKLRVNDILPDRNLPPEECHVSLSLFVQCTSRYPAIDSPKFTFENVKNLTETQLENLREKLNDVIQKREKFEVIYDLVEECKEFLRNNNKPIVNLFVEREQAKLQRDMEQLKIQQDDEVEFCCYCNFNCSL